MRAAANFKIAGRFGNFQFLEKDAGHQRIVMLPGMHDGLGQTGEAGQCA